MFKSHKGHDLQKKHVAQVLEQLVIEYQQAKSDRKRLLEISENAEDIFTLLEELELLTVSIRGFGLQFVSSTGVTEQSEAISQLRDLSVFDVSIVADFYFNVPERTEHLKSYVSLLDYLRLLMLEYLQLEANTEVTAA